MTTNNDFNNYFPVTIMSEHMNQQNGVTSISFIEKIIDAAVSGDMIKENDADGETIIKFSGFRLVESETGGANSGYTLALIPIEESNEEEVPATPTVAASTIPETPVQAGTESNNVAATPAESPASPATLATPNASPAVEHTAPASPETPSPSSAAQPAASSRTPGVPASSPAVENNAPASHETPATPSSSSSARTRPHLSARVIESDTEDEEMTETQVERVQQAVEVTLATPEAMAPENGTTEEAAGDSADNAISSAEESEEAQARRLASEFVQSVRLAILSTPDLLDNQALVTVAAQANPFVDDLNFLAEAMERQVVHVDGLVSLMNADRRALQGQQVLNAMSVANNYIFGRNFALSTNAMRTRQRRRMEANRECSIRGQPLANKIRYSMNIYNLISAFAILPKDDGSTELHRGTWIIRVPDIPWSTFYKKNALTQRFAKEMLSEMVQESGIQQIFDREAGFGFTVRQVLMSSSNPLLPPPPRIVELSDNQSSIPALPEPSQPPEEALSVTQVQRRSLRIARLEPLDDERNVRPRLE